MPALFELLESFAQVDTSMEEIDSYLPQIQQWISEDPSLLHYRKPEDGRGPLHFLVPLQHQGLTELFLSLGADVNVLSHEGNTPLQEACCYNYHETVRLFIEHGADIHFIHPKSAFSMAHYAALPYHDGGAESLRILTEHGCALDLLNEDGRSPLHVAVYWGQLEVAQFLVERGVRLHLRDKVGRTPLELGICMNRYPEVVSYLEHVVEADRERSLLQSLFSKPSTVTTDQGAESTPLGSTALESALTETPDSITQASLGPQEESLLCTSPRRAKIKSL